MEIRGFASAYEPESYSMGQSAKTPREVRLEALLRHTISLIKGEHLRVYLDLRESIEKELD